VSAGSGISWTDNTWSIALGCEPVSPGCDRCWAVQSANTRAHNPNPKIGPVFAGLVEPQPGDGRLGWTGEVRLLPSRLVWPLRWRAPKRVFVESQGDLFHRGIPDEMVAAVFAVMAACPRHTFQVLTKRHGRMRSLLARDRFVALVRERAEELRDAGLPIPADLVVEWPLRNVWVGVSAENQHYADLRGGALLDTPAAVRWVSAEPLIDRVRLGSTLGGAGGIGWVVAGGESGAGYRPLDLDWIRSLRDECAEAGVPLWFKQLGGFTAGAGGRLVDGREHLEMPPLAHTLLEETPVTA
jgi:protein gp37